MGRSSEPRWTIDELGDRVEAALATDYEGPSNRQVRAIPDKRTIRYYTTLGLLDRPVEMRGRTALYGPRHLMQIVAVKRLQASGLSLAEVQSEIAGASNRRLAAISRMKPSDAPGPERAPRPQRAGGRTEHFWHDIPEATGLRPAALAGVERREDARADRTAPTLVARIDLAPGVTLLVEPARVLDEADSRAVRESAAPLLRQMQTSGMLDSRYDKE